jgi:hypothetical protein
VSAAINAGDQASATTAANGVQILAADSTRKACSLTPLDGDVYYLLSSGNVSATSAKLLQGQSLQFPLAGVNYTGEIKMLGIGGTVAVSRWTL